MNSDSDIKYIRGGPPTAQQIKVRQIKEAIWTRFQALFAQNPGRWPAAEKNSEDAVDVFYETQAQNDHQFLDSYRCDGETDAENEE
jgi:hypothetical protein